MRQRILTAALAIPVIVGAVVFASPLPIAIIAAIAFVICLFEGWRLKPPLFALWGPLYVGLPLASLVLLHGGELSSSGWVWASPLFMALLPLWAGDTAGIFGGMAFGKRLLAPTISPKKTVEGACANLSACIVVAALIAEPLGIDLWVGLSCGVATGIFGQAGDLFESWLKRRAEVKDSGGLLPGHGGLLDRIDSLLFSAIPVYLLVTFAKV